MKTFGFAAPKITKTLRKLHAGTIMEGQGFIVQDTEGPLDYNEINRAYLWARSVVAQATHA